MPFPKAPITGSVVLPDGQAAAGLVLTFHLSQTDTSEGFVVLPAAVVVVMNGTDLPVGVELYRNTAGLRGTITVCTAEWVDETPTGRVRRGSRLGQFQVGDDAGYNLADLLDQVIPEDLGAGWFQTITQAQYDRAIEAESAAQGWATDAETARDEAALSAAQAALYEGAWLDDVAALLADTSLTYGPGAAHVQAGDIVRTRAEGFAYEVANPGATDHHVVTSGGVKLKALAQSASIYLEQFGITDGADISDMLEKAMLARPTLIAVGRRYTGLIISRQLVADLAVGGVDHPGLIVDFCNSEITKTGSHTDNVVRTRGVLNMIVANVNIDVDNKAARAWYHSSFRTEFNGFCRFTNCYASNVLQVSNSVPAVAWRVDGAMEIAEMLGGGASSVTPQVGVTAKVTRGFQTSTNFDASLVGLRNFPRVTICRNAKFDTITDDTDGDGVSVLHATTALDWFKSIAIIEDCEITDAKKRAVKTQCAWTEIRRNIVRHTVDAGVLIGEEFGVQIGGGVVEDNRVYYEGTPRCVAWLGVATNPADFGRQVFRRNKIYLQGGDATSGDYTKTSLIQGAEMLGDAVYHPGLIIEDNEVIGGSYKHLIYLRPRSRSAGIITVGLISMSGNLCDLTNGLIAFKRASAVPGDTGAAYSQIELLTIAKNTNTLADVPVIDEIDTNVSYTRSGWDENKGLTVPAAASAIRSYEFAFPVGLSNVAHTFDVPFTATDIQSFEISATASTAGATTRQSHFLGYLHVASGTITEYAVDRRDDAYTGLWSFSLLSSPNRLRVTKAAGAGGNAMRGHLTVKLKG